MRARTSYFLLALAALACVKAGEAFQGGISAPKPSFNGMPVELSTLIMTYNGSVGTSRKGLFISFCGVALSDKATELITEQQLDIPRHGEALLQAACRAGLYSVAELLVERGASITSRVAVSAAAGGNVALFKAINPGCTAFREKLREKLYHADDKNHFHMVRHLLDNGALILACRMKVLAISAEKGSLK